MARQPTSDAKWIDPDAGAAEDPAAAPATIEVADPAGVDRFHNQTLLPAEAVMEALSELRATMEAIDERLAALEARESSAVSLTRRLGLDVVEMGDALSRRLRALETQVPPPISETPPSAEPALFVARTPPARRGNALIAVTIGMILALILVLAGAWALQFYNVRGQGPSAAAHPAAVLPDAGAVTIAPATVPNAAPAASPPPVPRRAPRREPAVAEDSSPEPMGHVLYNAASPATPKP